MKRQIKDNKTKQIETGDCEWGFHDESGWDIWGPPKGTDCAEWEKYFESQRKQYEDYKQVLFKREQKSAKKKEFKIWYCNRYDHCQDDDQSCIECSLDNWELNKKEEKKSMI
jgi:hypothetical protein